MKNVSFTKNELLECNVTKDMETFTYFRTPGSVLKEYYMIKNMKCPDATHTANRHHNIQVFGEIELKAQRTYNRLLEPCFV